MLAGNLSEFGLADVIQLLSLTKKTGVLHLETPLGEGLVEVHDGAATYAVADRCRMPLAARLLAEGLVDEEALPALVRAQAQGGDGVAAALAPLAEDALALDGLVREQLIEAMFELLRQPEGDFTFAPGTADGADVALRIPGEDLLASATARLSEWSRVEERLPGDGTVLALAPTAPHEGVVFDRDEWALAVLLDGKRTVAEVVQLCGRGRYPTTVLLAELVGRGVVEAVDPEAGEQSALAELVRRRDLLAALEASELGAPAPAPVTLEDMVALHAVATSAAWPEPSGPEEVVPEPEEAEPAASSGPRINVPLSVDAPEAPPRLAEPATHVPATAPPTLRRRDSGVDRAAVARELASLGLGDEPRGPARKASTSGGQPAEPAKRDEEAGKGLLNRLFDGVKGQ